MESKNTKTENVSTENVSTVRAAASTPAQSVFVKKSLGKWCRVRLKTAGYFDGYTRPAGSEIIVGGCKDDVNPLVFTFVEEISDKAQIEELETRRAQEAKEAQARRRANIRNNAYARKG